MDRLSDEGIALRHGVRGPGREPEGVAEGRGWSHTWVSSGATTHHVDFAWTDTDDGGQTFWRPGYSYYLLSDGKPIHLRDDGLVGPRRSCRSRTSWTGSRPAAWDWEDSPPGWPQEPTRVRGPVRLGIAFDPPASTPPSPSAGTSLICPGTARAAGSASLEELPLDAVECTVEVRVGQQLLGLVGVEGWVPVALTRR